MTVRGHLRTFRVPLRIPSFCVAAALIVLAACSQVESVAPIEPTNDPTHLYLRLTLNYAAVNLSTDTTVPAYHTLQLVATPFDGTGAPIAGASAAIFTSLDTSAVTVSPDGLLQARRVANEVKVVASLTLGAVRHTDTAVVNILDVVPPTALDTLSIRVPTDSAVWYVSSVTGGLGDLIALIGGLIPPTTLSPRVVDNSGSQLSGLTIDYVSLDSTVAVVDRRSGTVTPISTGHAPVVARTIAFGVAKADTMIYTVQPPFTANIIIGGEPISFRFFNTLNSQIQEAEPVVSIVAGGIVSWQSVSSAPMDITFDDPANATNPPDTFCGLILFLSGGVSGPYCGSGDVAAFSGDPITGKSADGTLGWRSRQFLAPGTYAYHSTTNGRTGKIVVIAPSPLVPQ